ncbi:MAG: WGR domain-containing protein [Pseudomonadota bacterium]
MQNSELVGVDLSRVDPEQNMARFYGIAMRPTLFGEVSVVRCWGRTMSVTYADAREASEACTELKQKKRRRGYWSVRA